jgi:glycosyltransferase involved in cell wall biosynthesis
MRILVVSDSGTGQVNGVTRTYQNMVAVAGRSGIEIITVTPDQYFSVPCPTYPEIRLALTRPRSIAVQIEKRRPDYIHVATEGPLGLVTKLACSAIGRPFTTAYHTRFPEYLALRKLAPLSAVYSFQRHFHNSSLGVMIRSAFLTTELRGRGFQRTLPWVGGVDARLFRPRKERLFGRASPVFLYVGRLAIEKNIEAFLDLNLPGLKVVVGDGPYRCSLQRRYPEAIFCGWKFGEDLAQHYASADVFVFPSRTDSFGMTILEAMASGVPVAAYPVPGPLDLVTSGVTGYVDEDLRTACLAALNLDGQAARTHAEAFPWERAVEDFVENILRTSNYRAAPRRVPRTGVTLQQPSQLISPGHPSQ